jgi:hypothetical protein
MSSPSVPGVSVEPQREPQLATLGWALRRAVLGLVILLSAVALGAWLTSPASFDAIVRAASGVPVLG